MAVSHSDILLANTLAPNQHHLTRLTRIFIFSDMHYVVEVAVVELVLV